MFVVFKEYESSYFVMTTEPDLLASALVRRI